MSNSRFRDRQNNYIPGVHEESDFSFGSEYIQDARAHRPSRLSHQTGNRSWVGVGESASSGDQGGHAYSSREYNENPAYLEDAPTTSRPSFAGCGPQGYRRSDERIMEDINERLTEDHDVDAWDIFVESRDGAIVLKGSVPDRESRFRAEEIAASCSGVRDVENQLRIKNRDNAFNFESR